MTQQTPLPYALRFCALARLEKGRNAFFRNVVLSGMEVKQLVESIEQIHLENNRLKDELKSLKELPGCPVEEALECIQAGQIMQVINVPQIAVKAGLPGHVEVIALVDHVRIQNPDLTHDQFRLHYHKDRFTPYTGEQK